MAYSSELRKSNLSNRWVIIAAERGKRPISWETPADSGKRDPFDPGNIKPDEVLEQLPAEGAWRVLALKNVFPMLTVAGEPDLHGLRRDGYGMHELVLHSRDLHDLADLPAEQTVEVLELYEH